MAEAVTTMRKLFLIRHAKSSWADPEMDDFDRPLNKRGRRAAHAMAEYLGRSHIRPSLALVSASLRTRATWDILEGALEGIPVTIERCIYEAAKGDILHRLQQMDPHLTSVMVVGHSPGLPRLAEALCGTNGDAAALAALAEKYPTGALAEIDLDIENWHELQPGTGRLTAFIRPKDLTGEDED